MMKDTPAGVAGSEGITAPPGTWPRSIAAKPPGAGMDGMDMGVPCCITADPGGEEPPGGKKTWAIAPEGIQGLALAIQSPVCWLVRSSQHTQSQKHAKGQVIQMGCVEPETGSHTDTWTHTQTENRVPDSSVSCVHPLPVERKKSLIGELCFSSFEPLRPRFSRLTPVIVGA